jgi:hypothetical protein
MTVEEMVNDIFWIKAQWYECEDELLRVKQERDRYKAALKEIAKVAEFLPKDFEHDIAAKALGES